jgi:nickel/cobalt transporter (NiCoT) family protein
LLVAAARAVRSARWSLQSLRTSERAWLAAMLAVVLAVNALGWGIYLFAVMPHHLRYQDVSGSPGLGVGVGVAITAWFLGSRHAFDADHISCIDNTTRKLMADGKRPLGTGFFFSLGHSTIVVAVAVGITVAARAVFGALVDPRSAFETIGGTIGTLASAGFLYLIAALNLVVLAGIVKVFREMREGAYDEHELEAQLQARGLMYRFFGRLIKSISHSWQLFPVGMVFGIGFDTATEVVLLAATAYAALRGLPFYAVLALPLLFSGGLMLFDSLDGCFMNFAYSWAFARPVRKVYYNLIITGLSIGAAFIIGSIEVLGVVGTKLRLQGAFWSTVGNFNINLAGICIAGVFVAVWVVALAYWRLAKVEDRWAASLPPGPSETEARGIVPGFASVAGSHRQESWESRIVATWELLSGRGALDRYHGGDHLCAACAPIARRSDPAPTIARMLLDSGIFAEPDLAAKIGQIRDRLAAAVRQRHLSAEQTPAS